MRASPLLIVLLLAVGCSQPAPPKAQIRPVRSALVTEDGGEATRGFAGVVQASQQSDLAFRVAGSLRSLEVKTGTRLSPGQVIAELDRTDYQNRVDQTLAQQRSARSQRDTARPVFERAERLYQSGTVSLADYQAARGELDAASAQLDAAQRQLEAARNQLAYTSLKAPYAGITTAVHVEVGEVVGTGTPVVTVSAGDAFEVETAIPEHLVAAIEVGDEVQVLLPTLGDLSVSARVSEVGFSAEPGGTFSVTARLERNPDGLRPGMASTVSIDIASGGPTLRVPVSAVAEDGAVTHVYLLEPADGGHYTVHKQPVELGALSSDSFAVQGGVAAGDRVVTAGLLSIVDGMKVRLLEPAE